MGQTVVVHGAGGVALFGLQIAKAQGARTIVVSGSSEKLAPAERLGAAHRINHRSENWVEAVWRLTGDRGEAAGVGGRISVIGVLEGFEISGPVGPLTLKGLTVQGIGVGPSPSPSKTSPGPPTSRR